MSNVVGVYEVSTEVGRSGLIRVIKELMRIENLVHLGNGKKMLVRMQCELMMVSSFDLGADGDELTPGRRMK
jgi:hypothetical protein